MVEHDGRCRSSAPCQLDLVLLAEGHQHIIEELAAVVGVDCQQRRAAKPVDGFDHQILHPLRRRGRAPRPPPQVYIPAAIKLFLLWNPVVF